MAAKPEDMLEHCDDCGAELESGQIGQCDSCQKPVDRLFIGVYPGGITYADRGREEYGDYARLAFLPYDTLELKVQGNCPDDLRERITKHAASIQARRGERYAISTCNQTVLLGGR